MKEVRFIRKPTSAHRVHYLNDEDVLVVLERLPERLWSRLRAVHFNDRAWGNRLLGYVTAGRREIVICALPQSVSLGRLCRKYDFSASQVGAPARGRWPELAVRRCLLYHTFLHELGHMQIVDPSARSVRRKYAGETKAEQFAEFWRRRLWKDRFEHADPVHNPPIEGELLAAGPTRIVDPCVPMV